MGQEYGIYFSFLTHIFTRYLRNFHEKKFWTHENAHEKKFGPKKYPQQKASDPRNTHEKKLWTHEISTRKNYGPTKARWHDGTRPKRPSMTTDPRNLATLNIFKRKLLFNKRHISIKDNPPSILVFREPPPPKSWILQ